MAPPQLAEILPTHTPALFRQAVMRATELLRAGQLVALPTETVYGLAANALDATAVGRIFSAKGRPAENPIIVHVSSLAMVRQCVAEWPQLADRFAAAFWPGPLTLVLHRSQAIPKIVTAGGETVGVRWPSHPFIQEVIRECGFPLAAPSANRAGGISPTTAEHVRTALGDKTPLIVDGGPSSVGIESTVLDLTVQPPHVLRPGIIHSESLLAVSPIGGSRDETGGFRSPGMLPKHYSPKAKLVVWSWDDEADLRRSLRARNLSTVHVIAHTHIPAGDGLAGVSVIPHDPEAFARALYAELHRCDGQGAELIVVEAVPESAPWQAIADRLRRAASE